MLPYVSYDNSIGKHYKDIERSFKPALRRSGIRDFHFHDLRHTFASHLVMAGVDLTAVARPMGHKSLNMTLRYSHLSQGHWNNAVSAMDTTFNSTRTISTKLAQFGE